MATPALLRLAAVLCLSAAALVPAACSGGGGSPAPAAGPAPGAPYTTPLGGVCPDTVAVQADWWPGVPHAALYQLFGPGATADKAANRVTGPLGATGVTLEVRQGGPAVGFQPVPALLAQDDSLLLGYVGTDEAARFSATHPVVSVFATYEKSPLALLWGEDAWDFAGAADVGRSGERVLASEGLAWPALFTHEGLLAPGQVDTSYTGGPDRFAAAGGKIAQQGYVTNEPYRFEHDVPAWGKPVKHLLLAPDYPTYQNTLAVRADRLDAHRACLARLVPLFQQALADYTAGPGPANRLLLEVAGALDTGGYGLSAGLLDYGARTQRDLGLVATGPDGVLGSFEPGRVAALTARLEPVLTAQGTPPKPGLTPADLVTNEFLNPKVALR